MLETLKRLFTDLVAREPMPAFADDDPRLAVAALMAHVVAADGTERPVERQRMLAELAQRYRLSDEDAACLATAARRLDVETAALQSFTGGLARRLPLDERREIVESLWRVVLADGVVHEFEDNVVWRIAELLGIDPAERIALRKTVEADCEAALAGTTEGREGP